MLISARNLLHQYNHGSGCLQVLKGVDLDIREKDFLAIMGNSGSGKSTLLHILGCLLKPTSGTCLLRGRDILQMEEKELAQLRAETIAHVFQQFHLLPTMTVLENVLLPSLYNSIPPQQAETDARKAIQQVGLKQRIMHKPNELSGGEMQRVAIARALAVKPDLILADEPTGNLDQDSSQEILTLFREINQQGCTLVLVTHDPEIARQARSTKYLRNGHIYGHL
jgi:putative ABC transport system ATP-binding protein